MGLVWGLRGVGMGLVWDWCGVGVGLVWGWCGIGVGLVWGRYEIGFGVGTTRGAMSSGYPCWYGPMRVFCFHRVFSGVRFLCLQFRKYDFCVGFARARD